MVPGAPGEPAADRFPARGADLAGAAQSYYLRTAPAGAVRYQLFDLEVNELHVNATLIYLENEAGEYLMLHRVKKKNDINHDKWIGVGGGFEYGESPEECAVRETREETGLTLTDYRYRGIITFDCGGQECTQYIHLFTAAAWTGELSECNEGDLEWVPKEKVYDLPIWEGDEIFFRLLEEDRPFFSLKLSYSAEGVLLRAVLDGKELPV
ncbi:MAG: 8-oxo-dGTP diphosphatase [Oscillospiraceae bacterium]|nr:8-oxo-dGTP diphosphatase [Oscillospiraceae bacterium]